MTIDPVTRLIDWTVSHATILDFEDLSHNTSAFAGIDKLGSDNVAAYEFGDYVLEAQSQPAWFGDVWHSQRRILRLHRDGESDGRRRHSIERFSGCVCSIWTRLIWLPRFSGNQAISVTFTGKKLDGTTVTQVHATTGGSFAPETFQLSASPTCWKLPGANRRPFHQSRGRGVVVSSISLASHG